MGETRASFARVTRDAYKATCHMLESRVRIAFATNPFIVVVVARLSLVSIPIALAATSAPNNLPLAFTDTSRFS